MPPLCRRSPRDARALARHRPGRTNRRVASARIPPSRARRRAPTSSRRATNRVSLWIGKRQLPRDGFARVPRDAPGQEALRAATEPVKVEAMQALLKLRCGVGVLVCVQVWHFRDRSRVYIVPRKISILDDSCGSPESAPLTGSLRFIRPPAGRDSARAADCLPTRLRADLARDRHDLRNRRVGDPGFGNLRR